MESNCVEAQLELEIEKESKKRQRSAKGKAASGKQNSTFSHCSFEVVGFKALTSHMTSKHFLFKCVCGTETVRANSMKRHFRFEHKYAQSKWSATYAAVLKERNKAVAGWKRE